MKRVDITDYTTCLSSKDAAKVIGYSEASLRKMRIQGRGPKFIKAGKGKTSKVLYARKDLEEFNKENSRKLESTAEWRKT